MAATDPRCSFCGQPVNPNSRFVWRRTVGWGRRGKAGGSDIMLREYRDEWACDPCVSRQKAGIGVGQQELA